MKILSLITSNWNTDEEFITKCEGPYGLDVWLDHNEQLFGLATHSVIACGTWSDPLPGYQRWCDYHCVDVVNAGCLNQGGYDVRWRQYALAALMAGFHFALNLVDEWDLLVQLDNDVLVGSVDFDKLLREFVVRPEEVLSPAWCGQPGGPFFAWKPAGVSRYVHGRLRPNVIHPPAGPEPMLAEMEMGQIMKGVWWNPWPQFESCRQDWPQESAAERRNSEAMHWPFVRQPHPSLVDPYRKKHLGKQLPVREIPA